ncbi:7430_t:CDS:1 [Funneliformis mosseae]|uniref:7430_t:CDS:1 n=1 Tax=Funneliformis mosseae TaxID=27381 RepID=A0A9N8VQR6_FUNMO|nr:7430_t:CDS:1 [Funneliformis mosseae]
MASSKLFLGNLPELSGHIIQYLRNDLQTLHSCVLVNRFFCRITTPILWEDPFSVKCRKGNRYNFLDIYLSYFNDDDKTSLKEFGIEIHSLVKPLFNYPNFIKTLNIFRVTLHVNNLINSFDNATPSTNAKFTFASMLEESFTIYSKNIHRGIYSICILLLKLFINSDASLNNFYMSTEDSLGIALLEKMPELYAMISDNAKLISNVKNISLMPMLQLNMTSQLFVISLPSLISSIRHLSICDDTNVSFVRNLIQSQTQLLSLSFCKVKRIDLLDHFKYCFNTLTLIKFEHCDFRKVLSFDGLRNLTNLKSLHFDKCFGVTTQFLQPLLDIPTPLKIKSLKVIGWFSGLDLLLQKIGSHLKHLELYLIDDSERDASFESIISFCDQIKFLDLSNFEIHNITQLYRLITHFSKHLRYLTIRNEKITPMDNCSRKRSSIVNSMIFKGLGQILPVSLEYFSLDLEINPDDFKVLLDNCQHVKLKKLLVRNDNFVFIDKTFSMLKEFVEIKRVKYLAYELSTLFNPEHPKYQNSEKLASQIQPFVKLRKYDDLILTISDFD